MAKAKKAVESTNNNSEEEVVKAAVRRYDDWSAYAGGYRPIWDRDWKLRHNIRVKYAYKGVSDTFVAMSHGVVETMAAALGNGRPAFDYEPEYPLTDFDAKPLNALVDCYWEQDQWDVKVYHAIDQLLGQGTAPVFLSWNIDHPEMENLGLEDAGFDPTLKSPMQLLKGEGYAFRRFLTTVDNLKKFEVVDTDPKSKTYGEMVPRFKNLSKLKDEMGAAGDEETDKARKEMFRSSTLPDADKRQISVLEIWDADYVTVVANRKILLEHRENPHKLQHQLILEEQYTQEALQKAAQDELLDVDELLERAKTRAKAEAVGVITFAWGRDYTDISLFYGRSEIDPIALQQEALNDMTNQNIDAVTHTLLPERFIDPKYASWINKLGPAKPGRLSPLPKGAMEYADAPQIPTNAFAERQNMKNEIREATAIDQVAKGVGDDSNPTATEIRAQMNQAGQRVEIKARMLEKDFFFQIGTILWRLIQLYVREPVPVSIPSATGHEEGMFDPTVYRSLKLRPKVTLEITAQQKREKERSTALEAYQILIQDPTNNLLELKKLLLPKMFDLDPEQVAAITTPEPQVDPMMGGAPVDPMAGMPPGGELQQPAPVPTEIPA